MEKSPLTGKSSKFYKDVKTDIVAGMPFGKKGDFKLKVIGYEVFRLYYDSKDKDFQIGSQRIKRVIR